MSVRVLVDAVSRLAEQPLFGDASTCICDAFDYHGPGPCSACLEGAVVEALASLREQAGVEEAAEAMHEEFRKRAAEQYPHYTPLPWREVSGEVREHGLALARAALRALGLEQPPQEGDEG